MFMFSSSLCQFQISFTNFFLFCVADSFDNDLSDVNEDCSYVQIRNINNDNNTNDPEVSIPNFPTPFVTASPIHLSSRLFNNVLSSDDLLGIRTELKILLLSDFDSIQGIPVEANQPLGCKVPIINLNRPAVLRVYYGLSKKFTDTLNIIRPTYGPISSSSSVGMDPFNFTTKPMSLHLFHISRTIHSYIINTYPKDSCPPMNDYFNHCTFLIYSGKNNNGASNSTLSYHSDCTFDHSGRYIVNRNSQKENTCVAVLTMGDSRVLHFKKRVAVEGGKGKRKWKVTDDVGKSFVLGNNSLFLLHPDDEKPRLRSKDVYLSQYVHGGVNIDNDNDLSLAMVFRVVSVDREYNAITSKLIPNDNDLKVGDSPNSDRNQCLNMALLNFKKNNLDEYTTIFQKFVKQKLTEWNWY